MSRWSRLHRLINRAAAAFCRHPEGTVCAHRHWDYDHWYHGYSDGFAAATAHAEAKADPFYPWPKLDEGAPDGR